MKLQNISKLITNNLHFFVPYIITFLVCTICVIITKKESSLLLINSLHTPLLDFIYKYITYLGEGYYFLVIIIVLGLIRFKYFFQGIILFLSSGAITQIIKNLLNAPRPIKYLSDISNLNFVDGVDVYSWGSFPSGHTTSAFTIFLYFSFLVYNKYLKFLFFVIAVNVGISRIYLVQHFLIDVWAGSLIGVITTTYIYSILENSQSLNNSRWYNYSFLRKNL